MSLSIPVKCLRAVAHRSMRDAELERVMGVWIHVTGMLTGRQPVTVCTRQGEKGEKNLKAKTSAMSDFGFLISEVRCGRFLN